MYADDLLLGHGRVSAAKGTVTLSVGCRLNWYRALPVSCVEHLALTVDGTRLIPDAITVELGARVLARISAVPIPLIGDVIFPPRRATPILVVLVEVKPENDRSNAS